MTSPFLSLAVRNISTKIFFDTLLSDKDLSKLLCSCKVMKELILQFKAENPIKLVVIKKLMTDKMLKNMFKYYSENIHHVIYSSNTSLTNECQRWMRNKVHVLSWFDYTSSSSYYGTFYGLRTEVGWFPKFPDLVKRNIAPELFFDCLLSDEDVSILLCTCKSMKEMILKWKKVFPIRKMEIKKSMTDKMLRNMFEYYSQQINKITIKTGSLLTMDDGYYLLHIFNSKSLIDLSIESCLKGGLSLISSSFVNLTSLKISFDDQSLVTREDQDSISKLSNLEKLHFHSYNHFDDASVVNYSVLTKMKWMRIVWSRSSWGIGLSGLGLSYIVANKELLVTLEIDGCGPMVSEEYYCLTTLRNLTSLTVNYSRLNDNGLNMICSSCLLIEYLDIRYNVEELITIEGLKNINCLIQLKTLKLCHALDDWLAKLCHNNALTYLDLGYYSSISNTGLLHLSSLVLTTNPYDDMFFFSKKKIIFKKLI
jgi:hypothetical protein